MTICSAVLIQYQRVTDERIDGQTDRKYVAKTCISMADARKNEAPTGNMLFLDEGERDKI